MKRMCFVFILMALVLVSAFGRGIFQMELVNEQEIALSQIDSIEIRYRFENITFYTHNSDTLIIKEYMTENKSGYFAKINNSGNNLVVEAGNRPIISFGTFRAKVEVYIPMSNKNITLKTSSGKIEGTGVYTASSINIESSSGSISVNSIIADTIKLKASSGSIKCNNVNGNTTINTSSGSINVSVINGDVSAEASSGSIKLGTVNGTVNTRTSSGKIQFAVTQNAGDITIRTTSGSVTLDIPRNLAFNFSSRSSSGRLNTPFSDKLFISLSDRNTIQGNIGFDNTSGNQVYRNININTSSGSIRVNWIN